MKANLALSKYKIHRTRNISIFIWLVFSAVIFTLLYLMIIYIASPYWHTHKFIKNLEQNNIVQLRQEISKDLLLPMQSNILAAQNSTQQWHGAGANYLKQVWPQLAKAQDPYKLLLLQFNSAPTKTIKHGYKSFPNTFQLTQGKADNRIEFEWERQSWRTWQLSKVCFYNPQPFDDTKRCASSKR